MGFQPKREKEPKIAPMILRDEAKAIELGQHSHILLLRKSASKLREYVDCFVSTQFPASKLIEIKYHFSKCRPEVMSIMEAMAKDPKRFEFNSSDNLCKDLTDKVHGTMFRYYNLSSNRRKRNPKIYINGEEFLTKNELDCMASIIESMDIMRINEYKLQEELKALEAQKNVFEIYQNEKLSSR